MKEINGKGGNRRETKTSGDPVNDKENKFLAGFRLVEKPEDTGKSGPQTIYVK